MKTRLTAIVLLLALALTACTPAVTPPVTEETPHAKPTEATELTEATETTEEVTEAPTEAPTEAQKTDVDLGVVEGSAYKNETLGIICDLPDNWYVYNEQDLAMLNQRVMDLFDSDAVTNALESGQTIIALCASLPATTSSLNVTVTKSEATGASEEMIVNFSLPYLKAQLEGTGSIQNIDCTAEKLDFCGETHTVIKAVGEAGGMQFCEIIVYLFCGDYLYNVTASSASEAECTEILHFFEAIH